MEERSANFQLLQRINSKFKSFCKHCTLHGMFNFYQTLNSWLHFTWSTIITSSLCLSVYLSYMIWWKFVDNPTFTIVESTHYSIDSISFPAVSICDSETIYIPNADNITWFLNLRGYDQEKINSFYKSFTDIKFNTEVKQYVTNMHNFLFEIEYSYDTLLDKLSKPCSVMIKTCVWRSKMFECSKLFRKVFTVMGYCCQFDVDYFREQVENDINFNCGVEISEGLDLTVNTRSILSNGSFVDSFINMYIFDFQNNLTLLDTPITVTGSSFFDVTLDVWAIDSSDDVKRLSLKDRKCFLSTDSPQEANSFQNCIMANILQKLVEKCRCLPFNYVSLNNDEDDFKNCTWEQLKCVYNMLDYIQGDIQYRMLERGCYQKCDHIQYETEITSLKIDRNVDYKRRGESRVVVHFADNTCMKYRREVLFTWDQMLANLGGIFGLCIGGSIVSIIELIWFFLEILFIVIRFQKKIFKPETNIKEGIILKKTKDS